VLQQRFRTRNVALRDRHVLRIERIRRRDPLIADFCLAVHRHLDDAVAIERELERLAHARIAAECGLLRKLAFADVDRDALITDLRDLRDLETRIGFELRYIGGRESLDEIELPGTQIREAHRRIGNRQEYDAIEMDLAFVPIIRKALEHDSIL